MYQKVKHFVKHSAIYSIGNIATKGIGIITLPIYTQFISVGDFGVFGILEITLLILVEILSLGQANSILVFNNMGEYKDKTKSVFFTIGVYVTVVNIIFLAFCLLWGHDISGSFDKQGLFNQYFYIILAVILLRVFNNILLNKIRADERSSFFTTVTLIKIGVTVGLIVYFVAFLKLNVWGIFYAYLAAEIIAFIIQLPFLIKQLEFSFDSELLKKSAKFGFPLIFSSIGIMILNLSDRYILNYYTDTTSVGLYDLGYRIAGVLNMFLIIPFNYTLMPAATKMYKQPGDLRYYSKVMTYLCFVIIWGGLAISLFSKEIVHIIALKPDFYPAFQVVPVIILSYVFSATRNYASLGMFLTQKTGSIAYITLAAGALNVILNFIFIPEYGMMAAAYNTLISFVIFYFVTKIVADKYFKIDYENGKLILMFTAGLILFFVPLLFSGLSLIFGIILKSIAVILFPVILYFFNFFEPIEIQTIKFIWSKWNSPAAVKSSISELLNSAAKNTEKK